MTREVFFRIETMEVVNRSSSWSRRRIPWGSCSFTRSPGRSLARYRWNSDSSLSLQAFNLFLLLSLFLSFFSPPITPYDSFDESSSSSPVFYSKYLIENEPRKSVFDNLVSSFPVISSSLVHIPGLVFGSAVSVHLKSSSSSEEEEHNQKQGETGEVDDVDLLFKPEENASAIDTGGLGHSSVEEPSETSHHEEKGEAPSLMNQSQTEGDPSNHHNEKKEDGAEEENFSFHSVQEEGDADGKKSTETKGPHQEEKNSSFHHEGAEEQEVERSQENNQSEEEKKDHHLTMPSTSIAHVLTSQHASLFNGKGQDEDEEKDDDDEDEDENNDELFPKEDKRNKKKSEVGASVDSHKNDIPIESIPIFNQSSREKDPKGEKSHHDHDVLFLSSSSSSPWKKGGEGSKEEVIVEKLLKKAKALGKALSEHQEYLARKKSQKDQEHKAMKVKQADTKNRHMLSSYTSAFYKPSHHDSSPHHHHGKKLSFTFSTSSSPFSSSFSSHSSSGHPATYHDEAKALHYHRGGRSEEGAVVFGPAPLSHLSSSSSGLHHDSRKHFKFREKVLKITKEILEENYRAKQLLLAYLKRLWYAKERVRKSLSTLLREYLKSLYQQYFDQIAETYALATYRRTPKVVKAYKKEMKKQAKLRSRLQEKILHSLQRHLYGHRHPAHYFIPTTIAPSFLHDEEEDGDEEEEEDEDDEDNLFLHPYGHPHHFPSPSHHHHGLKRQHAKKVFKKGMAVLEKKLESTFHRKLHRHLRDIGKDQLRSITEQKKHMRNLRDEMISQLSPPSLCETPEKKSSSHTSKKKEGEKGKGGETCHNDEKSFTESLIRRIQNFHQQHPVDISRALASSRGSLVSSSYRSLAKDMKLLKKTLKKLHKGFAAVLHKSKLNEMKKKKKKMKHKAGEEDEGFDEDHLIMDSGMSEEIEEEELQRHEMEQLMDPTISSSSFVSPIEIEEFAL
ncbi:hypothetical protein CSUI_000138 [Cystoisospora suis]|uniref:Uncharacterized protein n=1 Tax=Cystoisospora suis TaxID=483139 RepID=A0A2C6LHZ6_9APIC|nr:hypothetical protein CSUI_000138 [Cystoisospora suis]